MSVTKRELVVDVAERLGYTQNEVSDVVQATLDAIIELLSEGKRLEIRNFGVFELRTRDSRMGRNPRTGEEVPISAKRVGTFKPGKALKELVQNQTPGGTHVTENTTPHIEHPGAEPQSSAF